MAWGQFSALFRTELIMQWRRWGLWLALAGSTLIFILVTSINLPTQVHMYLSKVSAVEAANFIIFTRFSFLTGLLGFIVGLLTVDRIVRDQQLGITDIQQATPIHIVCYVFGKFLGNFFAVVLPCYCCLFLFTLVYIAAGVSVSILPYCLLASCIILLPASALIIAFTLFFASLVPLRMAQIGFPVIWLWAVLAPLGWPSIATTIFSPVEFFAVGYWFYNSSASTSKVAYTLINAILNLAAVPLVSCLLLLVLSLMLNLRIRSQATR
jgi:hypothetical protein